MAPGDLNIPCHGMDETEEDWFHLVIADSNSETFAAQNVVGSRTSVVMSCHLFETALDSHYHYDQVFSCIYK